MASLYPRSLDQSVPSSERRVHAVLQALDDGWHVFHGVAWQAAGDGRQGDGEADIVLLHRRVGLVVVEVKGGGIAVAGGRWVSRNADGEHPIKNPYEQATASMHALVRFLRRADRRLPFLSAGHAVAFPDLPGVGRLGPAAAPEITMVSGDLSDPAGFVDRVAAHFGLAADLAADHVDSIVRLLAPTVTVDRLLRDDIDDVNARLLTLTTEQLRVLDGLRRNRRVTVYGGAGTGKTVLAMEQARRLASTGFRTLLTCFNRPLADHLAACLADADRLEVAGFHALCRRLMDEAELPFPDPVTQEWWDDHAPDALANAAMALERTFDALVVDEGQDFSAAMFLALEVMLSRPDSPRYVFADDRQAIYQDDWEPPLDGVHFDLTTNCRNTLPIASTVAGIVGDPAVSLGAPGPEPELVTVASGEGVTAALGDILRRLGDGGVRPGQVAVVTQRKDTLEALRDTTDVSIETIHRFKGLEADVVVVVLERLETDRDRALAYIGTSRARAHLVVIAPPDVHAALAAER